MRTNHVTTGALLVCTAIIILLGGALAPALAENPHPLSEDARLNAHRQIQAVTADKSQWTKSQRKLDTQLVYAARMKATGVVHPAAPKLLPSLSAEADGRFKVEIKGTVSAWLLAAIKDAGGQVISSFPSYHLIEALLPVENAESLAGRDDVLFIRPTPKGRLHAVDSQGDYTHQAIEARASYPASGAGIAVGILSDSIDNGSGALSNALAQGNIDPSNSFVIPGQAGIGTAEGLAMSEIVHDLAPRAKIWFATSAAGEAQMASNIIALAQAGCKIIADDESYVDESPFQDGIIAQAIQTVTAMGVLYFSAAGNDGNRHNDNSGTWEGDFVSAKTDAQYGQELEFYTGVQEDEIFGGPYNQVSAYFVNLFWSDPLGASTNDYDLFMLDHSGDLVYSSVNWQLGAQDPYEFIENPASNNVGYYLAVTLYSGTNRFLHLDFGDGNLSYATDGCIRGHNGCDVKNSFSVAATPAAAAAGLLNPSGPYPEPFSGTNFVEVFSSDGPRRMFYDADGTPFTPGNFSSTGGLGLAKPDFTAADGVSTTLPPSSLNPFFGTSAATPHAAAMAALVWSYNPTLTADDVAGVLTNSCIGILTNIDNALGTWNNTAGHGILMALEALQNTPLPDYSAPYFTPSFVPGSLNYASDGQFQMSLAGAPGFNYAISVSTNLSSWAPLATLPMTNTSSVCTDANPGAATRFYRAALVAP
jgi:hypothetical protein